MAAEFPARQRFTRAMRLKQARDFSRAKREGQRLSRGCLIANWLVLPAGSTPRLGVITSRKLGGAVVRSRARRLLREAFRRRQHDFCRPVSLVLIARNSIVGKKFTEVDRDFASAMRQARLFQTVVNDGII